MHAFDSPVLVAAIAMFVGVFAQVIARHINVPGIVLLLVSGMVLGPDGVNIVRPQALGAGLEGIVGFAVAVILFEGGLNLNLRKLRRQAQAIQRLVVLGSLITSVGGALAARIFLGWDWRLAFLFGTLVIVTGPTVIGPLLRRIHAKRSVETILEAEGIFIDAVGATIAVVALEVLLAPAHQRVSTAVIGVIARFGVGGILGAVGGGAFALLMRFRSAIPEGLANIAALATAVMLFHGSDALVPESGITAVILAGMVIAHTGSHELADLRHFKEQLTALLVATLFVLLAANVRLDDVRALGVPGICTVFALIAVVRPINVIASTWGTDLAIREKVFLAWLSPRGIVAAAVSSLFAERMVHAEVPGGTALRALVFLVIAITVVVQGMSAGLVASLLGLRQPRNVGYVILGAHEIARHLGAALRASGEEVVFIDTDASASRAGEEDGFKVVFSDALDERTLVKAQVQTRRGCIGATSSESINFLFCKNVRERARDVATFVALERSGTGVSPEMVEQNRSQVLYGGARQLEQWSALARRKVVAFQTWRYTAVAAGGSPTFQNVPTGDAMPLTLTREKVVTPVTRDYVAQPQDSVELVVLEEHIDVVAEWMNSAGFELMPKRASRPA